MRSWELQVVSITLQREKKWLVLHKGSLQILAGACLKMGKMTHKENNTSNKSKYKLLNKIKRWP